MHYGLEVKLSRGTHVQWNKLSLGTDWPPEKNTLEQMILWNKWLFGTDYLLTNGHVERIILWNKWSYGTDNSSWQGNVERITLWNTWSWKKYYSVELLIHLSCETNDPSNGKSQRTNYPVEHFPMQQIFRWRGIFHKMGYTAGGVYFFLNGLFCKQGLFSVKVLQLQYCIVP